ncbi:hybrid sensor histidine kinase/response regulator [Tahibacter amnicola]|uniref:histidine kinase n=1 Tax=Tahibacter amnicola TaxID=2976241 RepID=A0ABY6BND3_9GAMM|nr:ATP-binding protein [Tahibacter amnicola]UXI70076.1 ATP-binding protein [Tahibacter amnicola]
MYHADPPDQKPLSLVAVAERLRNERIDRVVAGYREYHVALRRVLIMAITCVWAYFWGRGGDPNSPENLARMALGKVLPIEGARVLPYAVAFFVISLIWLYAVRSGRIKPGLWPDAAGSVANFIGIAVLLKLSWNLNLWAVPLLPLASIVICVRFSRYAFWASMAASVVIVGGAAPEGYWITRPAFAVFAVVLLVGLPMTVNRVLGALHAVSQAAVRSRDAQSRFIATMSHELRTPLNAIIPAAALIETERLSSGDRELIESLAANAAVLLHRVNEVLDVAAIDRGQLHIANEPFRFSSVLHAMQNVVGQQARDKPIRLEVQLDDGLDEVVMGDAGRVEQVLTNLVSNAIKFTPANGHVRVHVARDDHAPGNDGRLSLLCSVSDTGIGIADSDKAKIFLPFHQVSAGSARRHGGVGLGLHIVRSVSDRLGGTLAVSDNPGGGTVFQWRVSFACAAPGQALPSALNTLAALDQHRAAVPSLRCLVIEDNGPNRDILQRLLTRAGHTADFAATGPAGLALTRESTYDAVFLDLHMPGMSGMDVLAELRRPGVWPLTPPVVVLSADSDPESIAASLRRGATAYLPKPIVPQRLLDVLRQIAFQNAERSRESERLAPAFPAAADEPRQSPTDVLRQLGSTEAVRTYLNALIEEMDTALQGMDQAMQAGETAAALDHLHVLRNVFQSADFHPGILACSDMANALHTGQDLGAALSQIRLRVSQAKIRLRHEPELHA